MGDVTYTQIKSENIFSRKSIPPDIVCEDCGSKWTAMLIDIPVSVLINDLDEYSRKLCKNILGAPDPPLVLYVFRPSDKELMDTKITLACVVPSQSSTLQWIINHNATGLRAPKGCQIMPKKCETRSDIFEDSNFGFQKDVIIKEEEMKIESQEDFRNIIEMENFKLSQIEDDSEDSHCNKNIVGNELMLAQATEIHNVDNWETPSSLDPAIDPPKVSSINKINRSSVAASTPTVWATIPAELTKASTVLGTAHRLLTTAATAAVISTAESISSSKPSEYQNIRKRPREDFRNTEESSGTRSSSIELTASSSTDLTNNVNNLGNQKREEPKNQVFDRKMSKRGRSKHQRQMCSRGGLAAWAEGSINRRSQQLRQMKKAISDRQKEAALQKRAQAENLAIRKEIKRVEKEAAKNKAEEERILSEEAKRKAKDALEQVAVDAREIEDLANLFKDHDDLLDPFEEIQELVPPAESEVQERKSRSN